MSLSALKKPFVGLMLLSLWGSTLYTGVSWFEAQRRAHHIKTELTKIQTRLSEKIRQLSPADAQEATAWHGPQNPPFEPDGEPHPWRRDHGDWSDIYTPEASELPEHYWSYAYRYQNTAVAVAVGRSGDATSPTIHTHYRRFDLKKSDAPQTELRHRYRMP